MPPPTHQLPRPVTTGKITPAERRLDTIASFFDLDGLELAIKGSGFDLTEEVQLLVEKMRDADPSVALKAQRQWRALLGDMIRTNGLTATATEERTSQEDGATVRRIATTSRLLTTLKERSHDLAQQADSDQARLGRFNGPQELVPAPDSPPLTEAPRPLHQGDGDHPRHAPLDDEGPAPPGP